jgi:hypothetical protein
MFKKRDYPDQQGISGYDRIRIRFRNPADNKIKKMEAFSPIFSVFPRGCGS